MNVREPSYKTLLRRFVERRKRMRELRDAGWSNSQIAKRYNISRQRVSEILGAPK